MKRCRLGVLEQFTTVPNASSWYNPLFRGFPLAMGGNLTPFGFSMPRSSGIAFPKRSSMLSRIASSPSLLEEHSGRRRRQAISKLPRPRHQAFSMMISFWELIFRSICSMSAILCGDSSHSLESSSTWSSRLCEALEVETGVISLLLDLVDLSFLLLGRAIQNQSIKYLWDVGNLKMILTSSWCIWAAARLYFLYLIMETRFCQSQRSSPRLLDLKSHTELIPLEIGPYG